MGMVSLPPVCDTNLSQRLSFDNNNNNLREASFSSYLNHAEKDFLRKLVESTRDQSKPAAIITTTPEEDGDIEVFGAEKYFNGGVGSLKPVKLQPGKPQYMKTERLDLQPQKPKSSRSGTPSVRSESSLDSQKALLQNAKRNPSREKPSKSSQAKGFLYRCYCCYRNSVEVDSNDSSVRFNNTERYGVNRTQTKTKTKQPIKAAGLNFTPQNSISKVAEAKNLPLKMQIQLEDQKERKSIEVFGSSLLGKPNNTLNLEERLSMLSWKDVTATVKEDANISATISNAIYNDDAESDASSDLFEIESLSGNPNCFLSRQGSDCTDCVTPTTCYAPSEVSIEWSIITASAADFPITSDYDDRRLSTKSPVRNVSAIMKSSYPNDVKENQRRRSNLLMGCKSQKAVRVVGDGQMTSEKLISSEAKVRQRTESFGRLTRFEAEAKVIGFSPTASQRQKGVVLATNSFPRQYSPRIPNMLYV